jgi:uncharacterized protein (TIGR02646 family)
MIKLKRAEKPESLTDELITELTENFKTNPKLRVWDIDFIKKALLEMSHNKCCYCETNITEESKYMEVEHFYCKSLYPNKVVQWENLFPSCKRCNGQKSDHDIGSIPIIHPEKDNPNDYLYFQNYRYVSRNDSKKGQSTIDVLFLNDRNRLTNKRYELGETIHEKILTARELINNYTPNISDVRKRNKIINFILELLSLAKADSEYSALAATVILEDNNFYFVKNRMIEYGLWNDELTELENSAKNICLSLKII